MFRLLANDWLFPAANFKFVTFRIFEKESVVAGTVSWTEFRAFQVSATGFGHDLCNFINFVTCVCPECNSRAVRLMIWVLGKPEKFRGLVFAHCVKRAPVVI